MKKIHTKIIYLYNKKTQQDDIIEDNFYWYDGHVALAGGGSGGGGETSTTVQKADPWQGQQQYLLGGFQQAWDQYASPTINAQYYPGSTVVPFSPETQAALSMQTQRALNGSPVEDAAKQQLTDTLNGNYLYGGQGFNQALDAASRQIIPQIDSSYERAGRSGSGLAQTSIAQALSDSFANQYGNERQNQLRSTLLAPQIANQDYTDYSKLAEVGSQREALSGQDLQDAINRWNFQQNYPAMKLQTYMNLINGNYGNQSVATTTGQAQAARGSPVAGALGGAATGAAIGSAVPGVGTLIGAGVGALAGAFL